MGNNNEVFRREPEEKLFTDYAKDRSTENRNKIVSAYMHLPEILSRKFVNRGVEYDDLFQVASLALIKAAERYDPERGVKFASFATPTIVGEIKRYFRDKAPTIKIPRRIYETYQVISEAREKLNQSLQRPPRIDEIAGAAGMTGESVLEIMESWNAYNIRSFDQMAYEEDDVELHEMIGIEDPGYEKIENSDFLERNRVKLSDGEKEFIRMRFASEMTQKQIAEKIGVSQMYISRLEKKILAKYKKSFQM